MTNDNNNNSDQKNQSIDENLLNAENIVIVNNSIFEDPQIRRDMETKAIRLENLISITNEERLFLVVLAVNLCLDSFLREIFNETAKFQGKMKKFLNLVLAQNFLTSAQQLKWHVLFGNVFYQIKAYSLSLEYYKMSIALQAQYKLETSPTLQENNLIVIELYLELIKEKLDDKNDSIIKLCYTKGIKTANELLDIPSNQNIFLKIYSLKARINFAMATYYKYSKKYDFCMSHCAESLFSTINALRNSTHKDDRTIYFSDLQEYIDYFLIFVKQIDRTHNYSKQFQSFKDPILHLPQHSDKLDKLEKLISEIKNKLNPDNKTEFYHSTNIGYWSKPEEAGKKSSKKSSNEDFTNSNENAGTQRKREPGF